MDVALAGLKRRLATCQWGPRATRIAAGSCSVALIALVAAGGPVRASGAGPSASVTAARHAVAAGGFATCAVATSHHVDCWGDNGYGELGDGSVSNSSLPVAVSRLTNVTQVAVGDKEACALAGGGSVACWGDNRYGELGSNALAGPATCHDFYCSTTPVAVRGLGRAIQIAVGDEGACALLAGGTVDCWGDNVFGELGNGTPAVTGPKHCEFTAACSPTPVPVSGVANATQISAGAGYTCALLNGGRVDCWGNNSDGQLGNGGSANSNVPVAVTGIRNAIQITAGGLHACALLSNGHALCWGKNATGQLGNRTSTGPDTCPSDGGAACSTRPVSVGGLSNATLLTAGAEHTCALLSSGHVDCWGDNGSGGELGDGTYTGPDTCADGNSPCSKVPVAVRGIADATLVSAGGYHTCAVLRAGHIDCWGDDVAGELGNGVTAPASDVPVAVTRFSLRGALCRAEDCGDVSS